MFYRVNGGADTYLDSATDPVATPHGIPVAPGTPLRIAKVLPTDSRLVKGFAHAPVDGRVDTRHSSGVVWEWVGSNGVPAVNYREFNGNNGLHLTLPAGGIDALQVRGAWRGKVYADSLSLTEPGTDPLTRIRPGFPGLPFAQRLTPSRLSFFYDAANTGALADLSLLRIDPGPLPAAGASDPEYRLASSGSPPSAIHDAIIERFGPGYTARNLDTGIGSALSLGAGEFVHLVSPELDPVWGIEAVLLELDVAAIVPHSRLTIRIQDALDSRREIMGVDVQVPGPGVYTLRLDPPDQVFLPPEGEWGEAPRLAPPIAPPTGVLAVPVRGLRGGFPGDRGHAAPGPPRGRAGRGRRLAQVPAQRAVFDPQRTSAVDAPGRGGAGAGPDRDRSQHHPVRHVPGRVAGDRRVRPVAAPRR